MLIIQVILLAVVFVLLYVFIRNAHTVRAQALKRIAFILFLLVSCDAVLRPNDTNWVAHKLGVGRGADLVLYLLVVAFAFYALNTFLRFRNLERRFTDLVRAVAIANASSPDERGLSAAGAGPAESSAPAAQQEVAVAAASVVQQVRRAP